ncbi:thiamine pyrophosphate-binding protein [Salipiger marinus]|uniref:thiamine pyrophosphate-binding protein n=1 Tax=Salipiger marinus TaxID=555512 RepID=UPI001E5DFBA9|nr:thiamine pyrophosphate-binding protein [Salipiger manganoxidans]MCD1618751.1 thiamine pyrophosphate-binding protein [Salipiger manganoxidans]MEB3417809.1 thiamine pyrophosphate-binding protein [Salipiger manganoxidans]
MYDDAQPAQAPAKTHVHQAIAQAVRDHGIDRLFGLMGDANLFIADHFARACGGRFIPAAHEGSSVLMALAWAHVTGRVGVATITHGPALTNCVTALTEGVRGQIPMVLLAGDTPVSNPRHLQGINQREVVAATGAGFEQLRSPDTVARDVARAMYRAQVERRPVVLNMPADFMWQEARYARHVLSVFETRSYVPEGDALDQALGMVASARRPVILAGSGASGARAQILRLAERLEAPVATTLKAKGLFRGHPYDMDIFGTLSTPAAYDVIAKSDCILCFGAGLHDFTTDRGKLTEGKRLVQIDTDPRAIGRSVHPDAALVADAGLTADNFVHWLDEAEIPASGFTPELDPQTLRAHAPAPKGAVAEGCIKYVPALEQLEQALPQDRILVSDGGRFMTEVWCRISAPDPRSFVNTANFGSIGLGMPEAIGAAIAAPDRPVVLFSGDGGFMMGGLTEFNTAVRLKQDLIVILCNDSAYGAEHIQFLDRQMDPALTEFDWPCFADVATSLGGRGVLVRSEADLQKALAAIEVRDRPLLIELRLDPHDVPRMRM